MVVRFFRIEIVGTDETKLQNIKDWFDTKIEANDLNDKLEIKISLFEDVEFKGIFKFKCDLYIKSSIPINKYKDIISNHFQSLNKTGITSASIIQDDNCSHDSEEPQPCHATIRMEWNDGSS